MNDAATIKKISQCHQNTPTSDMLLHWEQKSPTIQRSIEKTLLRFRQAIGNQFCLQTLDVIVKPLPQRPQTSHKRCGVIASLNSRILPNSVQGSLGCEFLFGKLKCENT